MWLNIVSLYYNTLSNAISRHSVSDDDMRAAIGELHHVYSPNLRSLSSTDSRVANYNSLAHRCAYLHKYASFHTAMVRDILGFIVKQDKNIFYVFKEFPRLLNGEFKICSLGGGPGCDIVGVLLDMFERFGLFRCSARVIDINSNWEHTMTSVIERLRSGWYGPVGQNFEQRTFNWEYLTANLLEEVDDEVKTAIRSADLVTMVKFVSAAACESTERMLKKIFTMLKLGAVVLFIDNSSGGFRQLVSKAATDCNLTDVFEPIKYAFYTNEDFRITHWGYTSCYSTRVAVHMMQKSQPSSPSMNNTSKENVDPAPKSNNAISDVCSNDMPIRKELPTASSNGKFIQNKILTSSSNGNIIKKELLTPSRCANAIQKELPISGNPVPNELSLSGNPIERELPFSGNPIQRELPFSGNPIQRELPFSGNPIQRELPFSGNPIQRELPISGNPIQNEIESICKHDSTLRNELPSGKHGIPTKTPVENRNGIQNNNSKFLIPESTESECVLSTQRNVVTEVPILKETQNSAVACATVDSKSKIQQRANQSNQSDFIEFTINEDCLLVPPTNNGICATEISKSNDTYNNDRCKDSSSANSASVHKESSDQVSADIKALDIASSYVSCDVVLDMEVSLQVESVKKT